MNFAGLKIHILYKDFWGQAAFKARLPRGYMSAHVGGAARAVRLQRAAPLRLNVNVNTLIQEEVWAYFDVADSFYL